MSDIRELLEQECATNLRLRDRIAALEAEVAQLETAANEMRCDYTTIETDVLRLRAEASGSRALLDQAMDYFAGHGESTWARTLKDNIRGWLAECAALRGEEE